MSLAGRPSENGRDPVGPDIEYNPDNPPTVHSCTYTDGAHAPNCDGNCEEVPLSLLDVELLNEERAWARAGMQAIRTPIGIADQVCMGGLKSDMFDDEMKFIGLAELIVESGMFTHQQMDDAYKTAKLRNLRGIREQNEERVREHRTRNMLGIKDKRIIGPHGNPIE